MFLEERAAEIIAFFIIFFNVFGHFGNLNFVIAVCRKKDLRSRNGILMALVSIEHSICLLCQLYNVYLNQDEEVERLTCLKYENILILFITSQTFVFFMISVDILIDIIFPFIFRKINLSCYIALIFISSFIFPSVIIFISYEYNDNSTIFLCNPPLALPVEVERVWSTTLFFINFPTLICFSIIYFLIYRQEKRHQSSPNSPQRKIIHSLSILIIIFIIFWFSYSFILLFIPYVHIHENTTVVQSYCSLLSSVCFSQNYYVTFARSKIYRQTFVEQLIFIKKAIKK